MTARGTVQRIKWTVGATEIWYDGSGRVEKEVAHVTLGNATSRVEDRTKLEILYHDPRGHLMAVVSGSGALLAGFRYGPYGELLEQVGPESDDFLKRFNGKEFDATSGLSYYGHRFFDERTLSWTQADPTFRSAVELAGTQPRRAALYAFSLGNPVSQVDPDGANPADVHWSVSSGGYTVNGYGTQIDIPQQGAATVTIVQTFNGGFSGAKTREQYEFTDGQREKKRTVESIGNAGFDNNATDVSGSSLDGTLTVKWATSSKEKLRNESATGQIGLTVGQEGEDVVSQLNASRSETQGIGESRAQLGVGIGEGYQVTVTADQDRWDTSTEVIDFLTSWISPEAPRAEDQVCADTQSCEPAEEEVSEPEKTTSDKYDPPFDDGTSTEYWR
jgi:RHS repeat-associated protein